MISGQTGRVRFSIGGDPGNLLGYAVADAGDTTGDGVHDFLVGAPGGDAGYVQLPSGAPGDLVQIISGVDRSVLRTFTSTRGNENFGFDAVGLGDVNDDGIPDAALSAASRNTVYVVAGEAA